MELSINGTVVDEKEARKAIAKAMRADRKAAAKRSADYAQANLKAQAAAYRVLARKASGEEFPDAWRLYVPGHKWAHHLFRPVAGESWERKHALNTPDSDYWVDYDHYGYDLVGGVCNGAGYCWLVVMRDRNAPHAETVLSIGVHDGTLALEVCPGVSAADFQQSASE